MPAKYYSCEITMQRYKIKKPNARESTLNDVNLPIKMTVLCYSFCNKSNARRFSSSLRFPIM